MTNMTTKKTLNIVILFLAVFLFGYVGQAQTLSSLHTQEGSREFYIDEGASLKSALEKLEKHYNVGLLYHTSIVEKVTIRQSAHLSLNIEEALSFLLKGTDLSFKSLNPKTYGIYKNALFNPQVLESEIQQTITGTVTDAQTGEALPGVNVVVVGSDESTGGIIGTTTDIDGFYELNVPDDLNTLTFSYVGYLSSRVEIDNRSVVNVELNPDVAGLEELVVVGYGTQKRVSIVNAVSEISGEELMRSPASTIQQSLQGKVAGLTVLDKGGSPTSPNQQIVLRGVNTLYTPAGLGAGQTSSIGNNEPLVLVNGVEQPFQNVNPDDIESISVLKDASATAIYGSRAANGVILVTTKKAVDGQLSVSYHGFYALNQATSKPRHMELEPYMRLQNVAHQNIGAAPEFTEQQIQSYLNGSRLDFPLPYDWYNVMYDVAPQFSHSLTLSGGNEAFRTRVSLRYSDQDGIITNVNSETTEARINTIFNVSPSINITTDLNFRRTDNLEPNGMTDIFRLMMQNAIWTVPVYPDGTFGGGEQGNNPLLLAEEGGLNRMDTNYIIGNIRGNWEIAEGLMFSTQYAIDTDIFHRKDFVNTWETRDGSIVKRRNQTNRLNEFRNISSRNTFENVLNYSLALDNNHSFNLLGGYSQIEMETSNLYAYRQDFYNNDVQALSQGADDASKNNTGGDTKWALRSVFGRFNYSFQDKYLLEINSRYDGSSRFTGDNQYSFFPSFSAGWRLSQEEFWSGAGINEYINEFKLRGSWGETGKETVALYSYLPTMNLVSYSFNGNPVEGVIQMDQANEDLTWEKTTQLNFGLDAEFFSNRLSLTVDYYEKITDGILLTLPVPATFGLGGGPQNAGKVENKGWEFAVGMRNNVGEFSYRANLNFNINENKVLSLAGTGPFIFGSDIDPRYITGVGYSINSFWGYKTGGLFQSDEEAQNYPRFQRNARAGDVKFLDLNNDGVINPDDMTYLGNSYPTYTFGANFNVNYKSFGLNVLFQGVADVYMRYSRALAEAGNFEGFTPDIYTGNYWTPENTDARFARPTKRNVRNQASSDRMLIDASYLRLKNLQLSYELPADLTNKISVNQMTVYISGTNLFTISDLNEWNLDPESVTGWQNYYPQTSVYTLGVRFQL